MRNRVARGMPAIVLIACAHSSERSSATDHSALGGPSAGGIYQLLSVNSGLVLDVAGGSVAPGATIDQWPYEGGANQKWTLDPAPDGSFHLVSVGSGLCLDVIGVSTAPGAQLQQWTCWDGPNQRWSFVPATGGAYELVSENSGLALDVVGVSQAPGAPLQQWSYWGGGNQQWQLVPVAGGAPGAFGQTFQKDGNNGTVSCDTFCGGPQWGPVGSCVGSAMNSIPCNLAVGYLTNGVEQSCTCRAADGSTFEKGGNNGTVSCDTFCAGQQWGESGACVSSSLAANASVTISGVQVSYDSDCSVTPGFIDNGAEMACLCGASPGGGGGGPVPAAPFGNETLHPDVISFYMVPDLESAYTSNWGAVAATFAQLHKLMPNAWVRWDNETGHNTNDEAQVRNYVAAAASADVPMIVAASACPNYNNMWANRYVTGNPNAQANASILDIANGGFLGFTSALLGDYPNIRFAETINEPDGPGWFVTDPDSSGDFDVYMANLYSTLGIQPGNTASAAKLLGPAVAFEGNGNIWNDWMGRSELGAVSYHTYAEPARSGLHDVPGKSVYVTEYGYQTTPLSPASVLDDLWHIEKDGAFSGSIQKVFYDQLMQNGGNPAAFSQRFENGQTHFAERGWFRALAAWVAMAAISTNAERNDATPDYLSTDDGHGATGILLWNYSAGTESGTTRTTAGTSAPAGADLSVLHILYGDNSDSNTGRCALASQQNVVSVSVSSGSVSVTVNALGPNEAVYVSTRQCSGLAD